MGANQSARKVTVVNDEASGVIKISDSVVQRLKGEISGDSQQQQQQQSAPAPEPERVSPPPAAAVEPPPPPPAQETAPAPPPAQSEAVIQQQVWQRPIIQYIEEPSISALRVKAEKEEEMKTQDDYWRDRLQKQEVRSSESILFCRVSVTLCFVQNRSHKVTLLLQESFITNAKLTEGEVIKNAKYVETLFKPAVNKEICR